MNFSEAGRLPVPEDNAAIAIRTLPAGTEITYGSTTFSLSHTILEGHRFAIQPIHPGENLLSWGQPFGVAVQTIAPGDYVCNAGVLRELGSRTLDFLLPDEPNFVDQIAPFMFDESRFQPAPMIPLYDEGLTFDGYPRPGGRGAGTRNMIVLLGTSSLTAGFVRALESQLKPLIAGYTNIDGIVAVAHTEGGHKQPNNRELLLRTLAGFMVHSNVGAVLAVDYGSEAVNNAALREFMEQNGYPLVDVPHHFMSLSGSFQLHLDAATEVVRGWLNPVNDVKRKAVPLSELKIALQCGGSDAFSGVSGNPLAAWVAKEVIRNGGFANHAETDELIGAESYMVHKVRNAQTAKKFLATVERFKEWAGWHGHSAEGNPSGGNKYRGLYNIYLKSLGAAAKRDPDVRLDYVIDYGEPMREAGFYFMDSPGNDLESIAGQIASGCNLIFFITGNGSITNFPFVPTIKFVTTTERYELLSNEMDVNAGAYLDGVPLEELGSETFKLTVNVASGQRTVGEQAGHTQVQIWRDWRLTSPVDLVSLRPRTYDGQPIGINSDVAVPDVRFPVFRTEQGYATDQVGLILPTSLCSGQIARMCVNSLNEQYVGQGLSRFVTLVHTEGCGSTTVRELNDTYVGYLSHPMVKHALLLEHGCEMTHNSYVRQLMLERGIDLHQFGWASVQLDGGIQNVIQKMRTWFGEQLASDREVEIVEAGLEVVRLALVTHGGMTDDVARQWAAITRWVVAAGGTVVVPGNDDLLRNEAYRLQLVGAQHAAPLQDSLSPTLAYAQHFNKPGFHIMDMPSQHWGETLTGLGATGVELILAQIQDVPMMGHPMIPVLQVTSSPNVANVYGDDMDGVMLNDEALLQLMVRTLSRQYVPNLNRVGNTDFQITRGLLGVSL